MKRLGIHLGVAILTFSLGTLAGVFNPLRQTNPTTNGPLIVTITPLSNTIPSHGGSLWYTVTVQNVSEKTIRGYSLGISCNCISWDSDGNLYPPNESYLNPTPHNQTLQPGESLDITMPLDRNVPPRVWVDLVHFADGTNWGPNRGHKEGYVRE